VPELALTDCETCPTICTSFSRLWSSLLHHTRKLHLFGYCLSTLKSPPLAPGIRFCIAPSCWGIRDPHPDQPLTFPGKISSTLTYRCLEFSQVRLSATACLNALPVLWSRLLAAWSTGSTCFSASSTQQGSDRGYKIPKVCSNSYDFSSDRPVLREGTTNHNRRVIF